MPDLPSRPSLRHLRKQAKARHRERGIPLSRAQHELARAYGFASWPRLVQFVGTVGLDGIQRALLLADADLLAAVLATEPATATSPIEGMAPLQALLRGTTATPGDVRACAQLLLDAGADPAVLLDPVERGDAALVRLLVERGAPPDDDAFYHASLREACRDTPLADAVDAVRRHGLR